MSTPFVSSGKLTCILHAINNFAGETLYERNIYPIPHTFDDFMAYFRAVPANNVSKLVVIPTHVFHIFTLLHVKLPVHMFAIRDTHIYNYVAADEDQRRWWKIDSTYGLCEKIHGVQIGFGDAMILLALTQADEDALRNALIDWDCGGGRTNEYYVDARRRLLGQLGSASTTATTAATTATT